MKVHVVNGAPSESIFKMSVIVDVLRSSSTITAALNNGAESVIPFSNIRDAIRFANTAKRRSKVVLAGERHGITPKGFNYNISPLDMTRENVEGRTIVYSSTNLTRILSRVRGRSRVLIGGLNNAKAVANYLKKIDGDRVMIIACGTNQGSTIEDLTGAGAIVDSLVAEDLTDGALIALGLYRNPDWRSSAEGGRIARKLRSLGFERDIDFCLSLDISSVVPGLVRNKIVNLSNEQIVLS